MKSEPVTDPTVSDISWLADVREVEQPLSRLRPIWVRESILREGPQRFTVPYPERHPFCEISIGMEKSSGIQYIGREQLSAPPQSVMLLGPGIPHYAKQLVFPARAITIYFLPIFLFDSGPQDDGARILNRFTAEQPIHERFLIPPPPLSRRIRRDAQQMLKEFRQNIFGSQFRLRSLLLDTLVDLLRWENTGQKEFLQFNSKNWQHIQGALNYIQEHYSESLYIKQIARYVGISESRLKNIFRESLDMSCVQYIKAYRISLAAAKLSTSKESITEIAFSVGYETLSNFNTAFHKLMGVPPTKYIASVQKHTSGRIPRETSAQVHD